MVPYDFLDEFVEFIVIKHEYSEVFQQYEQYCANQCPSFVSNTWATWQWLQGTLFSINQYTLDHMAFRMSPHRYQFVILPFNARRCYGYQEEFSVKYRHDPHNLLVKHVDRRLMRKILQLDLFVYSVNIRIITLAIKIYGVKILSLLVWCFCLTSILAFTAH